MLCNKEAIKPGLNKLQKTLRRSLINLKVISYMNRKRGSEKKTNVRIQKLLYLGQTLAPLAKTNMTNLQD